MSRKSSKSTPSVMGEVLYTDGDFNGTKVNSEQWTLFLQTGQTFYFDAQGKPDRVNFTARYEEQSKRLFWYAYAKNNKLFKAYIGRTEVVDSERLNAVAHRLYELINKPKEEV